MDKQLSPTCVALIDEITSEFDGVPLEDGVTLHQARALDDYEDDIPARSKDTEARWQDVSEEQLLELHDVLSIIDPQGIPILPPGIHDLATASRRQELPLGDAPALAAPSLREAESH
jgi:hypothetical protein